MCKVQLSLTEMNSFCSYCGDVVMKHSRRRGDGGLYKMSQQSIWYLLSYFSLKPDPWISGLRSCNLIFKAFSITTKPLGWSFVSVSWHLFQTLKKKKNLFRPVFVIWHERLDRKWTAWSSNVKSSEIRRGSRLDYVTIIICVFLEIQHLCINLFQYLQKICTSLPAVFRYRIQLNIFTIYSPLLFPWCWIMDRRSFVNLAFRYKILYIVLYICNILS